LHKQNYLILKGALIKYPALLIITVLSGLVLSACNPTQLGPEKDDWTMAIAPSAYVTPQDTQELLQDIENKTDGQILIHCCKPGELLIKNHEILLFLGTGFMEIAAPGCETDGAPWMRFHEFPYFIDEANIDIYRSFAEAQYTMIEQIYRQQGAEAITPHGMPGRPATLLLVTTKPVITLTDIRGMKICVDTPEQTALLNELGAVTTSLPIAEVYWALWRNTIDGIIIEPQVAINYSLDEVADYSVGLWPSMTIAYYGVYATAFNELPDDQQSVLLECFEEYSTESWESVVFGEAEAKWQALTDANGLDYTENFSPEDEAELIRIARTCWQDEIIRAGSEGQQWLEIYETVTGNSIPDQARK
jgi:TRAP-type C4-dicarboxylate transport system substrate-binding protein